MPMQNEVDVKVMGTETVAFFLTTISLISHNVSNSTQITRPPQFAGTERLITTKQKHAVKKCSHHQSKQS